MEKIVKIYNSFKDAADDNSKRLSLMNVEDRLNEFAVIQQRVWGKRWTATAIEKKVTFEHTSW